MAHDEDEHSVIDILYEMMQTERSFHSIVRFLDGNTRNHIVAAHMRNTSQVLAILRTLSVARPRTESFVMNMNIPLNSLLDPSGNFLRNFLEPVTIAPTPAQIEAAVDNHVGTTDTTCAICQENVTCATRIRACGHAFHSNCIREWFSMNPRCPVCRHDIRDLQRGDSQSTNDSGVHADEE